MTVDYAAEVKDRLTMGEVLAGYGLARGERGRIPCPIHNGRDKNFSYRPASFRCFVCGASGSIIDFAMAYQGLSFPDAVKRLNDDFSLGLPVGEKLSRTEQTEAEKRAAERRKQREKERIAREGAISRFWEAFDRWKGYDTAKAENAPQTPFDALDAKYVEAVKNIDRAAYELDQAEAALDKVLKRY